MIDSNLWPHGARMSLFKGKESSSDIKPTQSHRGPNQHSRHAPPSRNNFRHQQVQNRKRDQGDQTTPKSETQHNHHVPSRQSTRPQSAELQQSNWHAGPPSAGLQQSTWHAGHPSAGLQQPTWHAGPEAAGLHQSTGHAGHPADGIQQPVFNPWWASSGTYANAVCAPQPYPSHIQWL